jgi:hypothetical protein
MGAKDSQGYSDLEDDFNFKKHQLEESQQLTEDEYNAFIKDQEGLILGFDSDMNKMLETFGSWVKGQKIAGKIQEERDKYQKQTLEMLDKLDKVKDEKTKKINGFDDAIRDVKREQQEALEDYEVKWDEEHKED